MSSGFAYIKPASGELGTFTKAQLDTAVTDGNVVYVGDALNGTLGATTPAAATVTSITTDGTVSLANHGVMAGGIAVGRGASSVTGEQITLFNNSTNVFTVTGSTRTLQLGSTLLIAHSGTTTATATKDTSFGRASAGVYQIGDGGANALGSLNLTNCTATGRFIGAHDGTVGATTPSTVAATTITTTGNIVTDGTVGFSNTGVRAGGIAVGRGAVAVAGEQIQLWNSSTNIASLTNAGMQWGSGYLISVSATTASSGTKDTSLSRSAAGVWQFGNGTANTSGSVLLTNLTASGTIILGTYTVGTLPSAASNTRARAFVTDSNLAFNSTNLGSIVTAGGSTLVPVFSNGTNWVIG